MGSIIGTGDGRGAALMMVLIGFGTVAVAAAGYLYRPLRDVEQDLPDWDEAAEIDEGGIVSERALTTVDMVPEVVPELG